MFLADPDAPRALLWALEGGGRQACSAYAWAIGLIDDNRGAAAALRVLERYRRSQNAVMSSNLTVAAIPIAEGVEIRAQLSTWGEREMAHLRTWFRGRDGKWRPTRRGVTVPPDQLEALEVMVRALREAYVAGYSAHDPPAWPNPSSRARRRSQSTPTPRRLPDRPSRNLMGADPEYAKAAVASWKEIEGMESAGRISVMVQALEAEGYRCLPPEASSASDPRHGGPGTITPG